MNLSEWFGGPNPRLIGAMRRKLLHALLRREEAVARRCGLPPSVVCPVCGHAGPFFHPVPRRHAVLAVNARCPHCGSRERQRLMKLALDRLEVSTWRGPLLHFAPEPGLAQLLRQLPGLEYATADRHMPGVDFRVDLQALPFADGQWRYILCSHVLEHVPDDEQALRELRRVLRPDGLLLLCVPALVDATETVTFDAPDPHLHGHLRAYGSDFIGRVAAHFDVTDMGAEQFPLRLVLRHGLASAGPDHDLLLACTPRA
jgi:SAM-dependent methyltransferase